jgi:hypothetical protein
MIYAITKHPNNHIKNEVFSHFMSSSFSGFRDTEIKESIIPVTQISVGKTVEI